MFWDLFKKLWLNVLEGHLHVVVDFVDQALGGVEVHPLARVPVEVAHLHVRVANL